MARRAVVDEWRNAAALAIGICQVCRRGGAGAAGRYRPRSDIRIFRTAARSAVDAQAGNGSGQLIGFSMVSIFLRSLVYNVLFYALLVFWILVAIPTYVMPPRAFMAVA